MKILRDVDWKLVGFDKCAYLDNSPAFYFQHRKYKDVMALKVAKFIDVCDNIVYFFNADAEEKVCVSNSVRVDEGISSFIHQVNEICNL